MILQEKQCDVCYLIFKPRREPGEHGGPERLADCVRWGQLRAPNGRTLEVCESCLRIMGLPERDIVSYSTEMASDETLADLRRKLSDGIVSYHQ
jgi:hypothetical protein